MFRTLRFSSMLVGMMVLFSMIFVLVGCGDNPTQTCIGVNVNCPQNNGVVTPTEQSTPPALTNPTQTSIPTQSVSTVSGTCPSESTVANWMGNIPTGDVTKIAEICGFVIGGESSVVCPDRDGAVIEYSTSAGILYVTGCTNQTLPSFTQATLRFGSFYGTYDWPNPTTWDTNPCRGANAARIGSGGMQTVLLNPPGNVTSCPYQGITVQRL